MSPTIDPSTGQLRAPEVPQRSLSDHSAREKTLDRVLRVTTDFLPLVLLALLVLGTTWLVRSMPADDSGRATPPSDKPDYYLNDFQIRSYDAAGVLRAEIAGDHGDHIPQGDLLRANGIRSYHLSDDGQVTRASANAGVADRQAETVELQGQVRVTRGPANAGNQPPLQFESDTLHILEGGRQLQTDQPVTLTRGPNVVQGSGMNYQHDQQNVNIQGRVQATFEAARPATQQP